MIHDAALIRSTTALALAAGLCACASMPSTPPASADDKRPATVNFNSCGKPFWPAAALAGKRSGTVDVMFDIDADGKMTASNIARSSGHTDLDEAARVGIAKCTFTPGTLNGKPVASQTRVQYVWTLP